jgi:hypothetical protein
MPDTQLLAEFEKDVADWESAREALDDDVIRPVRHQFRELMNAILNADGAEAKDIAAKHALEVLARPDDRHAPTHSVAKNLHTATRQFGDVALKMLRRHVKRVS